MLMTSKHICGSCNCAAIIFDPTASRAKVPLVECSSDPPAIVDAVTPDSTSLRRYVFVSHIRSEGLGNDVRNSIPCCQLTRLRGYIEKLYDNSLACDPFWIDTACVPIKKDPRKRALKAVTAIVKSADKVLVIDSTLLHTVPESALVCLHAIRKSPWKKRAWTIKEGALARSLWFYFSTGPIEWSDILRQTQGDSCWVRVRTDAPSCAKVSPTRSCDARQGDTFCYSEGIERELDLLEDDIESFFGQEKELHKISQDSRPKKYKMRALLRLAYLSLPWMRPLAADNELRNFPQVLDTMREVYMNGSSKGLTLADRILHMVPITEQIGELGVPEGV